MLEFKTNLSDSTHRSARIGRTPARRGSVLIYSLVLMTIMFAMISLAVDYGRMQAIKTELQRSADMTARAALQLYLTDGSAIAQSYAPLVATNSYNPVDANSGVQPTVSVTWGYWNSTSKTFTAGSGTPMAVQVTVCRTAGTGNPVPLTFPLMNGTAAIRKTCDVWAVAVAVLSNNTSVNATISGQSDPWLAGMPSGAEASDYDYAPSQSPPMVMNVTPGTVLTFTGVSGAVTNDPQNTAISADGNATQMHSHNDDDPINEPATQNGVGNITAPINSLIGVFLTANAPNTQPAPTSSLDYSTQASRDQATASSLLVQQPFFIGDGKTTLGTTQTFVVPPERLDYIWDPWTGISGITIPDRSPRRSPSCSRSISSSNYRGAHSAIVLLRTIAEKQAPFTSADAGGPGAQS